MNNLKLSKLLAAAGTRMSNDLKEQLIAHPGELGTEREEIIRGFLRSYIPKRFEVSTGFVFDSTGNLSEQVDIIIADSFVCPRFETIGGKRIFPCESVVAVGQVKSSLTSSAVFQQALDNLKSVKSLDRSAMGKSVDITHQELIDHRTNHLHQIFAFLFVTGKSMSSDRVKDELLDYVVHHEVHLWPNLILSLDKYLVTFMCDDGVCPNPMHARAIAVQQSSADQNLLQRFYLLLGRAIEVTRVSGLPYWEYLEDLGQWNVELCYSTAENPPPFLSSLNG